MSSEILKCQIDCHCPELEHHFILTHHLKGRSTYGSTYLEVHLANLGWWERVKLGLKYIFGYKSRYGCYAEVILDRDSVIQIQNFTKEVLNKGKKNAKVKPNSRGRIRN